MQSDGPAPSKSRSWFPAKTRGWGWGLPSTWEGWVVLIGYLPLLALCLRVFPPHQNLLGFIISVHVLSGVLIVIWWWKGEPPPCHSEWRQGFRHRLSESRCAEAPLRETVCFPWPALRAAGFHR
jgi:hypothetical protein